MKGIKPFLTKSLRLLFILLFFVMYSFYSIIYYLLKRRFPEEDMLELDTSIIK